MNQVAKTEGISYKNVAIARRGGGGMLMPQNFGEVVAFSEIMARSQHAIPKHLREVPGACLAVTMQALRWELDPFLVASKSYDVKDIIAYEAQLIAAVVHTRAPLKTRPDYAYTGDGPDLRCTVSAIFEDGITRSYESPRVADIAVKNSPLWKADTAQQLGYYSIRAFARRYCPEVILGVYTPEEAETFRGPDNARDVTPRPSLSERLANSSATGGDGFSQGHVISEIGGEIQYPQEASGTAREAPSTDSGTSDANQNVGIQSAPPSHSSDPAVSPVIQTSAPPVELAPQLLTGGNSLQQSSDGSSGDTGGGDGVTEQASSPSLPEGWAIVYCSALRRAQKPISLPKFATQFWAEYGGWEIHKDTEDGATAAAIYNVFKENFGDRDAIEAMLREIV